jgi:(S)-mandelate dehydrogenase
MGAALMAGLHTIDAMRSAARRRMPRFAFDYIDGGAGAERAVRHNLEALARVRLAPHVLYGSESCDTSVELFGRRWALPIAVAPIGLANLVRPGADLSMARAAARVGIPFILSTAATTSIEDAAVAAPDLWFQLYVGREPAIVEDLLVRAQRAGVRTLIVTVDLPAPGKRVRDLNNRFVLPLRPSLAMAADLISCPRWTLALLAEGTPRFANLERYAPAGSSAQSLANLMASQSSPRLNWALLEMIRRQWSGELLVKGILRPDDARRLVDLGADGVVVSNHGGRQLDSACAPIEVLPAVRDAIGSDAAILMDGGIRSGEDVVKALLLGADMVLLGRAFLYGIGAMGLKRGADTVVSIFADELTCALKQLGASRLSDLRRDLCTSA